MLTMRFLCEISEEGSVTKFHRYLNLAGYKIVIQNL